MKKIDFIDESQKADLMYYFKTSDGRCFNSYSWDAKHDLEGGVFYPISDKDYHHVDFHTLEELVNSGAVEQVVNFYEISAESAYHNFCGWKNGKKVKYVRVILGAVPNGVQAWTVLWKRPNGLVIARSVEKPYLDKTLPPTSTNEEYHYQVAKYFSKVFFGLLDDYDIPYDKEEFAFSCGSGDVAIFPEKYSGKVLVKETYNLCDYDGTTDWGDLM